MTPTQSTALLVSILGVGPHSETALVGRFIARGHRYVDACTLVKNALVDAMIEKRIEQVPGLSVYRLTKGAGKMEGREK